MGAEVAELVDATDLNRLSTPEGNAGVNGVKVGEAFTAQAAGHAELRLARQEASKV